MFDIDGENEIFKDDGRKKHCRYYQIAGITIQLESDLPMTDNTFHPRFKPFQVNGPGDDTITIRHHFSLPDLNGLDLGKEVYRKPTWTIYKKEDSWIYISAGEADKDIDVVAVFNQSHSRARIYNKNEDAFHNGGLNSLTLLPTDEILLARVLANRHGCFLHSGGVILEGQGFLFVGHSGAGKSTLATMLRERAEILCDDRMIVRGYQDGFKIYGTWSHGEIPEVSPGSASLKAILFLEKAGENRLMPLDDKQESIGRILACLIKPLVTADWWEKMLVLAGKIVNKVPCYILYFNKGGGAADLLIILRGVRK